MIKPFSQACENNRDPILAVLRRILPAEKGVNLLEIGSGTGQHGVYFSQVLPYVQWYTSDLVEHHDGINRWIDESHGGNLHRPVELDVTSPVWGLAQPEKIDCVYSANTCHIMPWQAVEKMFVGFSQLINLSIIALYGPLKFNGAFTTPSNANFDSWLKQRAEYQGIRDFEKILALAEAAGFTLTEKSDLPANNHLLVFNKAC